MISRAAQAAIAEHALKEFPNESCGLIIDGVYVPVPNGSPTPRSNFKMLAADYRRATSKGGIVQACIHSHPHQLDEKPQYGPSADDMRAQISAGIVFGIVVTDGEFVTETMLWGDQLPMQPLLGRRFMHGVADCYTLIRDVYRAGAERCAVEHQIDWPLAPVKLPEVPRDDDWWKSGGNLYLDHFEKFGFARISLSEVRPGDTFLIKLRSDTINHGGVMTSDGRILHHLPTRLSSRDQSSIWARVADLWIRHYE